MRGTYFRRIAVFFHFRDENQCQLYHFAITFGQFRIITMLVLSYG